MRYLSVCSGIEAATVAWHGLGWTPVAFSEVDAFPSAVLASHYPTVPNWGDMTRFQEWPRACACVSHRHDELPVAAKRSHLRHRDAERSVVHAVEASLPCRRDYLSGASTCDRCGGTAVDLLVGGTPCQSFSVAGLRKGLADPRGNLALTYLAIADKYRPQWVVWENVPGVLSSGGGRDFGAFLGGLAELGYGWAYRVLDAQYFGLAQRRKRVFVVGCLGDWRRAAAVLFERASLSGHPAPRREARQTAPTLPSRRAAGGGLGTDFDCDGGLIPSVANPLTARMHKGVNTTCDEGQTMIAHALRGEGWNASEDGTGRGTPLVPVAHAFDARQSTVLQYGDVSGPIDTDAFSVGVMTPVGVTLHGTDGTTSVASLTDVSSSLRARTPSGVENSTTTAVLQAISPCISVRRLTPNSGRAGISVGAVAFTQNSRDEVRYIDGDGQLAGALAAEAGMKQTNYVAQPVAWDEELNALHDAAGPLLRGKDGGRHAGVAIPPAMAVRRLTPRECERLQGFPDDYTQIAWRSKAAHACPDGPRYKALGNSMAVPVMRWIGARLARVEAIVPVREERSA